MAIRCCCFRSLHLVAAIAVSALVGVLPGQAVWAAWSTVVDNGPPANRVDIAFVGDGYTQANLDAGLYSSHVAQYLDYMFGASGFLADPFPRYKNFFNVHQIDVVSQESGADNPSEGVYVNTALDAKYDSFGIDRLLTINESKANAAVSQSLEGTGITADIRLATVNDAEYGGAGGSWAVFAGANREARDIALHELSHSFSATADEYVTNSGTFPGGEPFAVNVTKDPSGAKWSRWLGFEDPRAEYLDVGVFEGGADYPQGVYRSTLDSKMRTLNRPFNAVVREKSILDVYRHVNPLDAWLANDETIAGGELWVDAVDPNVILVDWYVNDELIAAEHGEQFNLAEYDFPAGTYSVRAHAYDAVVTHSGDGSLLDLVRMNLDELQQSISWTVTLEAAVPLAGDYNLNGVVDDADLLIWRQDFGSHVELAADGSGNGVVDAADYTVWRNRLVNLGAASHVAHVAHGTVPEPTSAGLAFVAFAAACLFSGGRSAGRGPISVAGTRI